LKLFVFLLVNLKFSRFSVAELIFLRVFIY